MRVFAPGVGAGAVGGYAVLRVDPAVIARAAPAPRGIGILASDLGGRYIG